MALRTYRYGKDVSAIVTNLMTIQARSFAAVLFRKQASKSRKNPVTNESKDLFFSLSNEAKVAIRQQILRGLATEQVSHVRNKIGDAVAEVARQYTDNGTCEDH